VNFPGSSMVEHSAVNRRVASSSLARGAKPHVSANLIGTHDLAGLESDKIASVKSIASV
jgi:hypothetical protein